MLQENLAFVVSFRLYIYFHWTFQESHPLLRASIKSWCLAQSYHESLPCTRDTIVSPNVIQIQDQSRALTLL